MSTLCEQIAEWRDVLAKWAAFLPGDLRAQELTAVGNEACDALEASQERIATLEEALGHSYRSISIEYSEMKRDLAGALQRIAAYDAIAGGKP